MQEGALLGGGRFRVLGRLGAGGMGLVLAARDEERGEEVALKVLPGRSPREAARFKQEFRALADLYHPNLLRLGELFADEGRWFFTMERVDGSDLLTWVRGRRTRAPPPSGDEPTAAMPAGATVERTGGSELDDAALGRLRHAFSALASALLAIHRAGKVHRDVKPSNVLVTPGGRVVLLDFGLVTEGFDAETAGAGTVAYMSPEQAARTVSGPPADWYALGTMLFEALTGHLPFEGDLDAVLSGKQHRAAPAPSTLAAVPADLDALTGALLARDPAARPTGDEVLARLGASTRATQPPPDTTQRLFVGRLRELARLVARHEEVAAGGSAFTLVLGESGIGKSALLARLRATLEAHDRPPLLLSGRCFAREAVPFRAFDQAADALARALEHRGLPLPSEVGPVAWLFPALSGLAPLPPEPAEPAERRARAFAAFRALLAAVAADRPVVLVIDDLHFCDAGSLALVDALTSTPIRGLHLVGALREDPRGPLGALSEAARARAVAVRVEHLSSTEAEQLAELIAGPDAAALAAESQGHPLFLRVLSSAREQPGAPSAPQTLESALRLRIGRLPARARRVLALVSLLDVPVPLAAVLAAAGPGAAPSAVDEDVAMLRAATLLRLGEDPDDLEPYHDRVRQAMRHDTPAETARDLASALADALVHRRHAEAETIARALLAAGRAHDARSYLERAAEEAEQALAFERAAALHGEVLACGPDTLGVTAERLGQALSNAGRGEPAAHAFLDAATQREGAARRRLELRATEQLLRAGALDHGRARLFELLACVGVRPPTSQAGQLASLGYLRARIALRGLQPRAPAAPDDDAGLRTDVLWAGAALLGFIEPLLGATLQSRNLLGALDAGDPDRLSRALLLEASYRAAAGRDTPREREVVDRMRALARSCPSPMLSAYADAGAAMLAQMTGRWRLAVGHWEPAIHTLRTACVGVTWELATMEMNRLWSLHALGEHAMVRARPPELLRDALALGDRYGAALSSLGLCNDAWLLADDPAGARRVAEDAMRGLPATRILLQAFWKLLADVHVGLYVGDTAAAVRALAEGAPVIERSLLVRVQAVRVLLDELSGRVALASGDTVLAARLARRLCAQPAAWARAFGAVLALQASGRTGASDVEHTLGELRAGGMLGLAWALEWLAGGGAADGIERPDRFARLLLPAFGKAR